MLVTEIEEGVGAGAGVGVVEFCWGAAAGEPPPPPPPPPPAPEIIEVVEDEEEIEETIKEEIKELTEDNNTGQGNISPGLIKKHYSPKVPLRMNVLNPKEGEIFIGFVERISDTITSTIVPFYSNINKLFSHLLFPYQIECFHHNHKHSLYLDF